jgi:hypothetical protein
MTENLQAKQNYGNHMHVHGKEHRAVAIHPESAKAVKMDRHGLRPCDDEFSLFEGRTETNIRHICLDTPVAIRRILRQPGSFCQAAISSPA